MLREEAIDIGALSEMLWSRAEAAEAAAEAGDLRVSVQPVGGASSLSIEPVMIRPTRAVFLRPANAPPQIRRRLYPGTLPASLISPERVSDRTNSVALVIGGGQHVYNETQLALGICATANKTPTIFVCNDQIALFEGPVDHAITLHPDKMFDWVNKRHSKGFPPLRRTWCHRPYVGFTNYTRDWQGSSGLFAVKIARELGFTHIILCGVPMTVEDKHVVRGVDWKAAYGFRRAWPARVPSLKLYVRSMSGWTREQFGLPTQQWLTESIEDQHPLYPDQK